MPDSRIGVEVAYASPERQVLLSIEVPTGSSVQQVLSMSEVVQALAGIDLPGCPVGIFGKRVDEPAARIVQEGERIEIYRPLQIDPMEARRARAARAAQGRPKKKPAA